MNLALLQFRKDFRLSRIGLAVLAAVLLVDLAMAQAWLGQPNWEWPFNHSVLGTFALSWLLMIAIGDALTVTMASVFADSPSRENAFLRTRPMPAISLWTGKLLFLGTCIVVPLVLVEFVNLLLHGLSMPVVWAGTWQRLTLVLPVVTIAAVVVATATQAKSLGAFIGVGYGVGVVGLGMIALVAEFRPDFGGIGTVGQPNPDHTSIRFGLIVAMVLVLVYAWWVTRFRPGTKLRWIYLVVVILAAEWAVVLGPHDPVLRGTAQAEVSEKLAQAEMGLALNGISAIRDEATTDPVRLGWGLQPEFKGLPAGWFVRWGSCSAVLRTADSKIHRAAPYPGRSKVFRQMNSFLSRPELAGIGRLLPEDVVIESQDSFVRGDAMSYRRFNLSATGDWWHQPAELAVTGQGFAYQWELAAELPLKAGTGVRTGHSSWRLAAHHSDNTQVSHSLVLEFEGVGLAISDDQEIRNQGRWPANRYEFLIYDPVNRLARGLDHRHVNSGTFGNHTGFQRRTAILSFHERNITQKGWRENPEALQLLIFKLNYLGSFERTVETSLVPGEYRSSRYPAPHMNTDRIDQAEYRKRFSELKKPAAGASRAAVGNYMHSLLQLADAYSRYGDTDPVVRALAELVPEHLDLFIAGREVAKTYPRRVLDAAMTLGIPEDQKGQLIGRLGEFPELAEIVISRDWLEDAREELFALLDRPKNLPFYALRALAWFEDPRIDDRLIQELRNGSSRNVYPIVAKLPRLADRVDRVVKELWAGRLRHFEPHGSDALLSLALRHGIPEALKHVIRLLRVQTNTSGSFEHQTLNLIGEFVELPGIDRGNRRDERKVRAALLALGDVDFEFDRVFRKYRVIKKADGR